jgi:hypothetical protein
MGGNIDLTAATAEGEQKAPSTASHEDQMSSSTPLAPYGAVTPPSVQTSSSKTIEPYVPALAPLPVEHDDRVIRFEHRLLEILITIFSSETKLLANIIDVGNNIILNKMDLVELISMLTGTNCVDIITAPVMSGCISRFKLYDHIERIFVDGVDFLITRNAEFNYITQYRVSLDKCFDK